MDNNEAFEKNALKKKKNDRKRRKKKASAKKGNAARLGFAKDLLPNRSPSKFKGSLPATPIKKVVEPHPLCSICGKPIANIAEAFTLEQDTYVDFDCMIEKIRNDEKLSKDTSVSYIGSGNFGIFDKNEEGSFVLVKKIPVESPESYMGMKQYVEGLKK